MSAPGRWHNAIRVRAKPCVHRFNYSRTLRREVPPSGLWLQLTGNTMTIHRTWHTLININNKEISTHCLGFAWFLYMISANFKSIGNNTMKKMLLATALALLITGCSTDVYCSKQTARSTKGNHHPSFLRFWIGQKKTVDAAKICGGAENVVKTETQQNEPVNGLLGFITLGIYTPLEARVYCSHIVWVAHRYGQLYSHCSLIYFWVPSSCFCIVISLSLRVK